MFIKYISLFLVLLLIAGCGYKLANKKVPTSRNMEYPKRTTP